MPKKSFKGISPDNPALSYFSEQKEEVGQAEHEQDIHDGQHRPTGQDTPIIHDGHDSHYGQSRPVVHNGHDSQVDQSSHNVQYGQNNHVGHIVHDRPDGHIDLDGQDRPNGQFPIDKTLKCHINLRVSQELKDYLTDASWRERKNITQYLTDMIEADRRAKQTKEGENK